MKNKTVVKLIFFQAKYNSQLALFFPLKLVTNIYVVLVF
jgi:hypothetical protein